VSVFLVLGVLFWLPERAYLSSLSVYLASVGKVSVSCSFNFELLS
jgi:hypothetical protein